MLTILFVISMSIAFTNMFNGELMPFYIKYIIAIFWIAMWIIDIARSSKIEKKNVFAFKEYVIPFILIGIWSLFVWIADRPSNFSGEYISRMIGNVIYLLLTFMCAMSGIHFFGKKTIKLSALAMGISVIFNLCYVIAEYGVSTFFNYLPNVFSTTDFEFGSRMYNFALALEVQDITIATGFYLIYFIFFDKEDSKKTKRRYILLMIFCAVIGFKRTVLVGLIIVCICLWLIKSKNIPLKNVIGVFGIVFISVSFIYVVLIKLNIFEELALKFNIDTNGRVTIYGVLSNYYELSPLFIGNGFSYVDKAMYESIGFVAHSVIIKMFAEIGMIPFFIWLYHYLIKMPNKILNKYGKNAGRVTLAVTIYLFITYFMENTMTLFCMQYSFLLMILFVSEEDKEDEANKIEKIGGIDGRK